MIGRPRSCFTGKSAALLGLVVLQVHLSSGYTVTLSRKQTMMMMMRRSPRLLALLATSSNNNNNAADDDLLFDPLLSPHAYPDGTDAGPKKVTPNQSSVNRPRKSFGIALPTDETEIMMPTTTTTKPPSRADVDSPVLSAAAAPDVFDPTLSPHMYSNGTPDVVIGEEKTTDDIFSSTPPKVVLVGILLMDHGSKSAVANERLVTLANLYQQQQRPSTTSSSSSTRRIVRAAHMELAAPSIRDGIESLINEGVDEIICHPYFLSPGRHVREDIPNLVNEAIASLNVKIPVVITEPVGSNTDMMIQAIDVMVAAAAQQQQRVGK
jgi:sirohydrochlorin ferrochelatase